LTLFYLAQHLVLCARCGVTKPPSWLQHELVTVRLFFHSRAAICTK